MVIGKREGHGVGGRDAEREENSNGLWDRQGRIRKSRQGVRERKRKKKIVLD